MNSQDLINLLNVVKQIGESCSRIADGLEKLTAMSEETVQIEANPPQCPSCGKINPSIIFDPDNGGPGSLSAFVAVGTCGNCRERIYAVPNFWDVHKSPDTVTIAANQIIERDTNAGT